VVEASKDLVLILVDCTNRGATRKLVEMYGVTGLPSMVFADPDGKVVAKADDRSPDALIERFREIYEKHAKTIPWVDSPEAGIEAAAKAEKPLLVFFTDGEEASKVTEGSFFHGSVWEHLRGFVMVRHVIERECETCKRFRVTRGPRVYILNPLLEDPVKRPLKKITRRADADDLKKAIEYCLKRWPKILEKARGS
jgi:hypothetical protein